jgi:gluconolactonase
MDAAQVALTEPAVFAAACFLEGPAVAADGTVFFTDLIGNRILTRSPRGEIHVFRAPAGRANGQTFDREGRLLHCEGAEFGPGGARRITRSDLATGGYEVVLDSFERRRLNSPNDLCVDDEGRVYFTDPRYGDRSDLELGHESVYRIDPDGRVTLLLSQPDIQRPNGIALSPDFRTLYVVDSSNEREGNRCIWAFELGSDHAPRSSRLVFHFGTGRGGDGMKVDAAGNLYVAAGINRPRQDIETDEYPAGIYVLSPSGDLIGRALIPEDVVTNLAFGGNDRRTIYVTAGRTLYTLESAVPGHELDGRGGR